MNELAHLDSGNRTRAITVLALTLPQYIAGGEFQIDNPSFMAVSSSSTALLRLRRTLGALSLPPDTPSPFPASGQPVFFGPKDSVQVTVDESKIAFVDLHRPPLNLLTFSHFDAISLTFDEISAASRRGDIRSVILHGGDSRAFSAGLDLPSASSNLAALEENKGSANPPSSALQSLRLEDIILRVQKAMLSVYQCPVPVIAAVHGACLGAGLGLAAAADIRYCTSDAVFSVEEVNRGIVCDVGTLHLLPRICNSSSAAREMIFSGSRISGERALAIGLASRCVSDRSQLLSGARELAQQIATKSPLVVRGIKRIMADSSFQEHLDRVRAHNLAFLRSSDLVESMSSFVEKRDPKYDGT